MQGIKVQKLLNMGLHRHSTFAVRLTDEQPFLDDLP